MAELHTDLLSCQSELLETKKEITNSDSSKSLQQNGLEKQEMNVKNLWKMVEYELQSNNLNFAFPL